MCSCFQRETTPRRGGTELHWYQGEGLRCATPNRAKLFHRQAVGSAGTSSGRCGARRGRTPVLRRAVPEALSQRLLGNLWINRLLGRHKAGRFQGLVLVALMPLGYGDVLVGLRLWEKGIGQRVVPRQVDLELCPSNKHPSTKE